MHQLGLSSLCSLFLCNLTDFGLITTPIIFTKKEDYLMKNRNYTSLWEFVLRI